MGIRSSIGAAVANHLLAGRVRALAEQALDDLDTARPQDLAALERDLGALDGPPVTLEPRVDALEQAMAALEQAVAELNP